MCSSDQGKPNQNPPYLPAPLPLETAKLQWKFFKKKLFGTASSRPSTNLRRLTMSASATILKIYPSDAGIRLKSVL